MLLKRGRASRAPTSLHSLGLIREQSDFLLPTGTQNDYCLFVLGVCLSVSAGMIPARSDEEMSRVYCTVVLLGLSLGASVDGLQPEGIEYRSIVVGRL